MLSSDIIRYIKGYEGLYWITSNGMIINAKNGREVKQRAMKSRGGYMYVNLRKDGIEKTYRVHRLVAESYLPNTDNKSEVNHIDFNRQNNRVSNLEWLTSRENKKYSIANYKKGLSHGKAAIVIHNEYGIFSTLADAANMIGVSTQYLCDILKGRVQNRTPFMYA